ncbi:glycosyltransferase family 2 protein [Leucobacter sp. gxy201]|uniref:glycosyltransferase family 2 protein n=1 Tax=Leucobacter sp. gxy201 TaxID=2957200 RepID=UPI003DA1A437
MTDDAFDVHSPAAERWLEDIAGSNADERLKKSLAEVLSVLKAGREIDEDRPFLSVVMRTQGKKLEALQDALLTLVGQTDQDFELLLMAHNTDEAVLSSLREIVDWQMPSFRSRVQLIDVQGGGRSRPLNEAIEVGRGRYFVFFDDDDMVFGNWVEAFHSAAEQNPSRLLRAIASTQKVRSEVWPGGVLGFRTLTWPKAEYLRNFEYERHLEVNHSPFMSVAFPRELFFLWGERFDEVLDVCEDWDLILRGAFLLGVHSIDELTAIYRLWTGVTSSYTEHDRASWKASEDRVRKKLNSRPSILPEGAPASIVESVKQVEDRAVVDMQVVNDFLNSTSWKVTAPLRKVTRKVRSLRGK